MFYIYELVDPITNEVRYIGQTVNTYNRLHTHLTEAKHGNSHKNKWIRKLVKQSCVPILNVIDTVDSDVYFWERFYIDLYKSWGVNLTNIAITVLGGGNTFTNDPNKENRRKRMSEILVLRYSDIEKRNELSKICKLAWTDPILIEQARRDGKRGADMHVEKKRKMMIDRWANKEWANKMKNITAKSRRIAIEQIDEENNVIAVFVSVIAAAKTLNVNQSKISEVINNKRKRTGGLRFRKKI